VVEAAARVWLIHVASAGKDRESVPFSVDVELELAVGEEQAERARIIVKLIADIAKRPERARAFLCVAIKILRLICMTGLGITERSG
jgi:hypothetical protein